MTAPATALPLAACIHGDAAGNAWLEGCRCNACGEVLLERRRGCPKCAAVGTLEPCRLADTGRLYAYTIVHRSFPGIRTPFVSAVVELDGGGFIKGNLDGVEPDPSAIPFDLPVRVAFERLAGKEGDEVIRYVFVPRGGQGEPA